jgi:hypothetical protein
MGIVDSLKQRRDARRWQRWSENDPLDDYARKAGIGAAVAVAFFALVIVLVVVGFVVAR